MIKLKSPEQIELMALSGEICTKALRKVMENALPGITTLDLDEIAESEITKLGGQAAFKKVAGYRHTICVSVNDQVVHGIPTNYRLKAGDLLGIDIGVLREGFFSDMAYSFLVGKEKNQSLEKFLEVGIKTLEEAIKKVRLGRKIGEISNCIQTNIEAAGYGVVKEFVGHGIGTTLHEEPSIPGIGEKEHGEEMQEGMVLAIEVIYNMGRSQVKMLSDGWTVVTVDGLPSGLFEKTVAVTKKGPVVLTNF